MAAEAHPPPSDPGLELPLRRLLQVVFRRRFALLLAFSVLAGSAALLAFLAPPAYRSEAKLLIQVGRESVTLDPTAAVGGTPIDPRNTWENEVNSELEIARSAELRRRVVETVGAARILRPGAAREGRGAGGDARPSALARLLAWTRALPARWLPARADGLTEEDEAELAIAAELDVHLVPESSVIKIGFEAREPELARSVVAALIQHYLDKHLDVHRTPGSLEFFAAETARLERELAAREDELAGLKGRAGIASIEEQRRLLLERLSTLEQELALSRAAVAASEAKVRALEQALADGALPETVVLAETSKPSTAAADALRQELHALRLEEQRLLQDLEPDSRRVRAVREQIALATALLQGEEPNLAEKTSGVNPARQSVLLALFEERATLSSLRARDGELQGGGEALRLAIRELTELELAVKRLTREIATLEQSALRYGADLEQVRADQTLQLEKISNVTVLQPATLPLRSTRMGKKVALSLGCLLALVGALSFAFLCEFLDQSLRTPEDVRQRLGVPPLASVALRRALRRRGRLAGASLREFALVRERVAGPGMPPGFAIALTAAHRGEGVSTVAANLAGALARRGDGPVLLVDAALNAPSVQRALQVAPGPGLAELLRTGQGGEPRDSGIENLRVLTAGDVRRPGARGADPLLFDRLARDFEALLAGWKRDHAQVVVDLAAVGESSLVPQIAARCDAVLLVVAAGGRRWQVARHAVEELEAGEAWLLGAVLNRRRYPIPGWLYRRL